VQLVSRTHPLYSLGQEALQIKIIDTGIGIDPEFYPQIFQPFSLVDNSDQRAYSGAGLGLSIVKTIVTLLGGVGEREKVEDGGLTFVLQE
jgi:signal transduction histidine kinase